MVKGGRPAVGRSRELLAADTFPGGGSTPHATGGRLAACPHAVYIVHLPLVVTVQYCLAGRGLSTAGVWAVVCVLVVPVSFLLAAGLRTLPGFRPVL
jgi:hypothetical protein